MRLTESALRQIQRLLAAEGRPGYSLRISLQPGGCSGQFIYFGVERKQEGDHTIAAGEALIYVDQGLAALLEGVTLDYSDRIRPPRFRFRNLRADHRCACGRSIGSPYLGKSQQCRAYELPPWLDGLAPGEGHDQGG